MNGVMRLRGRKLEQGKRWVNEVVRLRGRKLELEGMGAFAGR